MSKHKTLQNERKQSRRMINPSFCILTPTKSSLESAAIRAGRECAVHNPGCDVVVYAEGCVGRVLAPYKLKRWVPTSNLTIVFSQQKFCNLLCTHLDCLWLQSSHKIMHLIQVLACDKACQSLLLVMDGSGGNSMTKWSNLSISSTWGSRKVKEHQGV